ncbi:MAG: hypothetical protein AB3N23_04810 [Paracoccaceae bacterium]
MRFVCLIAALLPLPVLADPPVIENVAATHSGGDMWRFDVTLSHGDTGWDDYADGWRVLDMDGNELGLRVLHHPHVEEQPFTRSLSGVMIPRNIPDVQVQARTNTDGWGTEMYLVPLR